MKLNFTEIKLNFGENLVSYVRNNRIIYLFTLSTPYLANI